MINCTNEHERTKFGPLKTHFTEFVKVQLTVVVSFIPLCDMWVDFETLHTVTKLLEKIGFNHQKDI